MAKVFTALGSSSLPTKRERDAQARILSAFAGNASRLRRAGGLASREASTLHRSLSRAFSTAGTGGKAEEAAANPAGGADATSASASESSAAKQAEGAATAGGASQDAASKKAEESAAAGAGSGKDDGPKEGESGKAEDTKEEGGKEDADKKKKKKEKKEKAKEEEPEELAQEDIDAAMKKSRKGSSLRFFRNLFEFLGKVLRYYRQGLLQAVTTVVGLVLVFKGLRLLYMYASAATGGLARRIERGDDSCLPAVKQVAEYMATNEPFARFVLWMWGPDLFMTLMCADHLVDFVHVEASAHLIRAMLNWPFFVELIKDDEVALNCFFSRLDSASPEIRLSTIESMVQMLQFDDLLEHFDPAYVIHLLTYRGRFIAPLPPKEADRFPAAEGIQLAMTRVDDALYAKFDSAIIDFLKLYCLLRPTFITETVEYLEPAVSRAMARHMFEVGKKEFWDTYGRPTYVGQRLMSHAFDILQREEQTSVAMDSWVNHGASSKNPVGDEGFSFTERIENEGYGVLLLPGKYKALMAAKDTSHPQWALEVASGLLNAVDYAGKPPAGQERRSRRDDAKLILRRACDAISRYYRDQAGPAIAAAQDAASAAARVDVRSLPLPTHVVKPAPAEMDVFTLYTQLLIQDDNIDEARVYAEELRRIQHQRPQPYELEARVAMAAGDYTQAETLLRTALDKDSNYAPAVATLGRVYMMRGLFSAAREITAALTESNEANELARLKIDLVRDRQYVVSTIEANHGKNLDQLPVKPLWESSPESEALADAWITRLTMAEMTGDRQEMEVAVDVLSSLDPDIGVRPVGSVRSKIFFDREGGFTLNPAAIKEGAVPLETYLKTAPAKGYYFEMEERVNRERAEAAAADAEAHAAREVERKRAFQEERARRLAALQDRKARIAAGQSVVTVVQIKEEDF
jgi:hypothetical protein